MNYKIDLSDFLKGDMRKEKMNWMSMKRRRGALKIVDKINYYMIIGIARC